MVDLFLWIPFIVGAALLVRSVAAAGLVLELFLKVAPIERRKKLARPVLDAVLSQVFGVALITWAVSTNPNVRHGCSWFFLVLAFLCLVDVAYLHVIDNARHEVSYRALAHTVVLGPAAFLLWKLAMFLNPEVPSNPFTLLYQLAFGTASRW